jgi:hypothetical protein
MEDDVRQKIIDLVLDHVERSGSASIVWACQEFKISYTHSDIDKISALIVKDGKYLRTVSPNNKENYYISRNPNHELNQSMKSTNASIQSLNNWLKATNVVSVAIAAITGFFIAMTYFRDGAEKPTQIYKLSSPIMQQPDTQQQKRKTIQSVGGSAIVRDADSFPKK